MTNNLMEPASWIFPQSVLFTNSHDGHIVNSPGIVSLKSVPE